MIQSSWSAPHVHNFLQTDSLDLHLHLTMRQWDFAHPHLTSSKRGSGAGNIVVNIGVNKSFLVFHPNCNGSGMGGGKSWNHVVPNDAL